MNVTQHTVPWMSERTVILVWANAILVARADCPFRLVSGDRVNTRVMYVLCPPIITPPPMTRHEIG